MIFRNIVLAAGMASVALAAGPELRAADLPVKARAASAARYSPPRTRRS